MVKITIDTNRDEIDHLEETIELIQDAITRRRADEALDKDHAAEPEKKPVEETAVDAGFVKITVEHEPEDEPTLNELLSSEAITEGELVDMFEKHGVKAEQKKKKEEPGEDGEYIEIVDFDEED